MAYAVARLADNFIARRCQGCAKNDLQKQAGVQENCSD